MARFIAAVWNDTNAGATHTAQTLGDRIRSRLSSWRQALAAPGMLVFVAENTAIKSELCPLSNSRGVIIGTLFRRHWGPDGDTYSSVNSLSESDSYAIIKHGPKWLIDNHWGWYVAFVRNAEERFSWVLRSPMSDLPCLMSQHDSIHIFMSKAEDLLALQLMRFSVNWQVIRLQVGFSQTMPLGHSAIREIAMLEGGEAAEVNNGILSKRIHWNPSSLAGNPRKASFEDTSRATKFMIRSCVHAWASLHSSILMRLSGGLDSSVVLRCLADAPNVPRVTCVNYFWDMKQTDERYFARRMAQHVNFELVESPFGTSRQLDVIRRVSCTAYPVLDVHEWQHSNSDRELVRSRGATATFTGSLGDSLFEHDVGTEALSDYLALHGINASFFEVAFDLAVHNGMSIWEVFTRTLRERWSFSRTGPWSIHEAMLYSGNLKEAQILVSDDTIEELRRTSAELTHPWLRDIEGVPERKRWQIASLYSEGFYNAHFKTDDDAPIVAPFLSQPLVELCLQTPSYLNARRGRDRALVRHAFEGLMPAEITRRNGKSSPNGWLIAMINRDQDFVREFLLDGRLVTNRIVDRDKLELALSCSVNRAASHGGAVTNLLYTEAWLRAWESAQASDNNYAAVRG